MSNDGIPLQFSLDHLPQVYSTLENLLSPDDTIRKTAESTLHQCENVGGFVGILLHIVFDRQNPPVPSNVRLLGIICLKNISKTLWKSRGNRASTSQEDQNLLKATLLQHINEEDSQVATQCAVLISIIARADWPNQWSTLFPSLHVYMQSSCQKEMQRGMYTLGKVLKELASRRLTLHKKNFSNMAKEVFPSLHPMWNNLIGHLMHQLSNLQQQEEEKNLMTQMNIIHSCTKALYYLVVHSLKELNQVQDITVFFSDVHQHLQTISSCLRSQTRSSGIQHQHQHHQQQQQHQHQQQQQQQHQQQQQQQQQQHQHQQQQQQQQHQHQQQQQQQQHQHQQQQQQQGFESNDLNLFLEMMEKSMVKMVKIVLHSQQQHAVVFQPLLLPFLDLFTIQIFSKEKPGEKILIQSLQFLSQVLNCREYRVSSTSSNASSTPQTTYSMVDSTHQTGYSMVQSFFKETQLIRLCQYIIENLLVLTKKDIEDWMEDPEGYILVQESLTTEESIRSAAENLFLTMLQEHRPLLAPLLVEMLKQNSNPSLVLSTNANDIIRMDAIYLSIGISSFDLHDYLEFEPWFLNTLVPALNAISQVPSPLGVPVLKRRILWVIGCWMAQITDALRPPLYNALLHLMVEESSTCDMAIRLCALQTLQTLVDDWGFNKDDFLPFLPQAIEALYYVLRKTQQVDTRLKVIGLMQSITHACGTDIQPITDQIIAPLPQLWQLAHDQSLLRSGILNVLAKIVSAIHQQSTRLYPILLPVVQFATDILQPDEVYLMDNGLELWKAIMENATEYTLEIHQLFRNLIDFCHRDLEHIKPSIALITSYALLGKVQFWYDYSSQVATILQTSLGNVKPEIGAQINRCIDTLLVIYPQSLIEPLGGLLGQVLDNCLVYIQKKGDPEPDYVLTGYMTILARCLFHYPSVFYALVQSRVGLNQLGTSQNIVTHLVDLYLEKYFSYLANEAASIRKKLWSLALCSLIPTRDETILDHLGQILDACEDTLEDIESNGDDLNPASLFHDAADDEICIASESKRKRDLQVHDQVIQEDLRKYVQGKMKECSNLLGEVHFQQVLQSVETSVLRNIQMQK